MSPTYDVCDIQYDRLATSIPLPLPSFGDVLVLAEGKFKVIAIEHVVSGRDVGKHVEYLAIVEKEG